MVKKVSRKEYESNKYNNFLMVSQNFIQAADLALEFEYYNASGVLIIHAAIALADAVTIRFGSVKCTGENHYEVIKLLQETAPKSKQTSAAITHFDKLIDHKNAISYQGALYKLADIKTLRKHYDRFDAWVGTIMI